MVFGANSCKIAVSHGICYYESSLSLCKTKHYHEKKEKKKALSPIRAKIEDLTSDLTSRCDFPVILQQMEPNSRNRRIL